MQGLSFSAANYAKHSPASCHYRRNKSVRVSNFQRYVHQQLHQRSRCYNKLVMDEIKTLTQRAMVVRPVGSVDSFSSEAAVESDTSLRLRSLLSSDSFKSNIIVVPCVIVHRWYVATSRMKTCSDYLDQLTKTATGAKTDVGWINTAAERKHDEK